jgi:hypothetical protein
MKKKADSPEQVWLAVCFIAGPAEPLAIRFSASLILRPFKRIQRRSDFRFAERLAVQSCFDALDYLTYIALGQH